MPVQCPTPKTPHKKEHHSLGASQELAELIDMKMQVQMKSDTSLSKGTNSAYSDPPLVSPDQGRGRPRLGPTMVKVTLKGVATQAKGIDAVLDLSGGSLSLVVVGGGGRDLDQTLLTMPFSCILYEPVPQYDTCMYLKVDMGENSSAGACDTIVIILPSRRVCEPAETKKKR